MTASHGEAPLRPAATILLLRDAGARSAPRLEAAMIERCERVAFAGGATVFPGGRVDAADHASEWRAHADGLNGSPMRAAAQVAAIREAFEETGVLLARRAGNDDPLTDDEVQSLLCWRERIEADAVSFLQMVADNDLRLLCEGLAPFAHWTAPTGLIKRYDTLFFAARAPADQRLRPDGVEARAASWLAPNDALTQAATGQRRVIFPTLRNLELLGVTTTVDETLNWARRRKIEPITPKAEEHDGVIYYVIPDGMGYPVTKVRIEQALRD